MEALAFCLPPVDSRYAPNPHGGRVSGPSAPPPTTGSSGESAPWPVGDSCPLCDTPLHPDQDWCLRCGAAARTRLAPSPNSKAPMIAVAVVAGLSLAVLAAALVKLAGESGSPKTRVVSSVTGVASVTSPGTATTTPAPSATTPAVTTLTPGAVGPVRLTPVTTITSSIVNLNGTVNPQGVPTTYQFQYGATTSYGSRAPGTPVALGAGTSAVAVYARVAYLTPGATYQYKLTASKAGRAISTANAAFTTPPAPSPAGARSTTPGKTGASGPTP
jgi:hypothetical protein